MGKIKNTFNLFISSVMIIGLLLFIFIVVKLASVPKTPATVEQVEGVLALHNYVSVDTTKQYLVQSSDSNLIKSIGAEKELTELTNTLRNEKLLKFCKLSIVGGGFLKPYHVEVNYCPAYLMQMLSNMTTKVGPMLGHDTKVKYAEAKASFVASSGKIKKGVVDLRKLGGMEDPHTPITYYLIEYNNFVTKV